MQGSVPAAAALMPILTVMTVAMHISRTPTCVSDTIDQFGLLQAAALWTQDLIAMLAALTTRFLFPDLAARCTFEYSICHGIAFFPEYSLLSYAHYNDQNPFLQGIIYQVLSVDSLYYSSYDIGKR